MTIPYARQNITKNDIENVTKVLGSDFLTQGPVVERFEEALIEYCKVKYALVTNSATNALHLACLALDLKKGDIVWTSPISFVASSNCALYCGADVDFVDIDATTYNLDPKALESKLKQAKKNNKLPKIVIPVHLGGQSCDMSKIYALSKKYNFKIIEDASHAIGGQYKKSKIGSCKYSDVVIFSFHPVKIITTGEGGALLTKDKKIFNSVKLLRSHGVTRDTELLSKNDGPWYYEQQNLGFHYRMNDIQAALGISQLKRIDTFIKKRNSLKEIYDEKLAGLPIKTPYVHKYNHSSMHLYVIRLQLKKIRLTHKEVFTALRDDGISVNLHYIPIYRHPYYKNKYNINNDLFPEAEKYYAEAISLPIYFGLKRADQNKVIASLKNILLSK